MRFNHFINEVKPPEPRMWAMLCDDILRDCKPFIKAMKGIPYQFALWRGAKKLIDVYQISFPRADRNPTDTPRDIQNMLDKIFLKKFGWKARSQGVFGTGSKSFAAMYGKPYMVFPMGEFKFIWSPEIKDLYTDVIEKDMRYGDWGKLPDKGFSKIEEVIESSYTDKDWHSAIGSQNEIMIKCHSYYLVNWEFEFNGYKELF